MGPEAIRERTKRKEGVALGPPPRSVLCGLDANCEAIHGSDTYLTNWPLSLGRGVLWRAPALVDLSTRSGNDWCMFHNQVAFLPP
jgi:hypothetical protein